MSSIFYILFQKQGQTWNRPAGTGVNSILFGSVEVLGRDPPDNHSVQDIILDHFTRGRLRKHKSSRISQIAPLVCRFWPVLFDVFIEPNIQMDW